MLASDIAYLLSRSVALIGIPASIVLRSATINAQVGAPYQCARVTGAPACARLLGADKVQEATPTMGAEDFSFFGHAGVPASFAFLGSGNAAAGAVHGLHTPQARLPGLTLICAPCQPHAGSAALASVLNG